jgi:hypothetical protein
MLGIKPFDVGVFLFNESITGGSLSGPTHINNDSDQVAG